MMDNCPTIQAQAVIYNNEKKSLIRTITYLANAVRVEKEVCGWLGKVSLIYGDASETPVFTDADVEQIRGKFGEILDFNYRVFGFNSGYGKGNNLLAEDSSADYLLIMNPDIIVSPRYLIDHMAPLLDDEVGLVEARQAPVEHHKEYDVTTKETDWACGACFITPAELFHELKGFDSDTFFLYCEDVDYSWRVRLAGYKIIYQPLSPVFHAKRISVKGEWKPSKAEVYYSAVSEMLLAYKWSNSRAAKQKTRMYMSSSIEEHQKAAVYVENLRKSGKLPDPIDPKHKVSKFIGNYYTENRFVL